MILIKQSKIIKSMTFVILLRKNRIKKNKMILLIIYIISLLAIVPIDKDVVITQYENPEYFLTVFDEKVRMLRIKDGVYKENDPNVCKIISINNKFLFKFGLKYLYKPPKSTKLQAENLEENDNGFLFDINETPDGFIIKSYDGNCLTVSNLLSMTEGNVIDGTECAEKLEQIFIIKLLQLSEPGYTLEEFLGIKRTKSLSNFDKNERKSRLDLI